MIKTVILIFYFFNVNSIIKQNDTNIEALNKARLTLIKNKQNTKNRLKEAKSQILKLRLKEAEYLAKLVSDSSELAPIKYYYLSIIHFLKKDYEKSNFYINNQILTKSQNFKDYCLLKILIKLANHKKISKKLIFNCQRTTAQYSINNQIWLKFLTQKQSQNINLFTKNDQNIFYKYFLSNLAYTKSFMKLALVNSQAEDLEEEFKKFSEDYYLDDELKELMSFVYNRIDNPKMSYKLVEDLNSTNAENIKGNFFLKLKKYEIALGHYQLALRNNPISQNAISKILPLSWILDKPNKGIEIIEKLRLTSASVDIFSIYLMFLIKENKLNKVATIMDQYVRTLNYSELPIILRKLFNYAYSIQQNNKVAKELSLSLCKSGVMDYCHQFRHRFLFDNLYTKKNIILYQIDSKIKPLKNEIKYIDQRDILELDMKNINSLNFGRL